MLDGNIVWRMYYFSRELSLYFLGRDECVWGGGIRDRIK